MSIRTALTVKFGLEYPLVSAPMGSVAGGSLAAAVSNAGALGLVGGAYGEPEWLRTELSKARSESSRPWGVGRGAAFVRSKRRPRARGYGR